MGADYSKIAFEICVVTTDYRSDPLGPGVILYMFDHQNVRSPMIKLEHIFQNEADFHQARFTIDLQPWSKLNSFGKIHHIEFWRTSSTSVGLDWFVDKVILRDRRHGLTGEWEYFFFPVHDWIKPDGQFVVHDCEVWLPQYQPYPEIRHAEIARRMASFVFFQRAPGLPVELEDVPETEIFSYDERWNIEGTVQDVIRRAGLSVEYDSHTPWDSLESLGGIYQRYNITVPLGLQLWMQNDICFGAQRLRGCNPFVINRCYELPACFADVADQLKPMLEGWSIKQLLTGGRLYMVDYRIMKDLQCQAGRQLCAPCALFMFTEKRQLIPLAIKINPCGRDARTDEPAILAQPPTNLWLQAKLWFNMVDALHHLIAQRLLTHLILESVYVSMRRNLGQSHPLYQLLAPHFTSFLAVTRKLKQWVFVDGWISRCIQLSMKGIRVLLKRAFKYWSFNVNANIYRELNSRRVYEHNYLGNYPYREDALLVYSAFEKFCSAYLRLYYPRGEADYRADIELQAWRNEVAAPMAEGGLGLQGVPGGLPKRPTDTSSSSGSQEEGIFLMEDVRSFIGGIWFLAVIVCGSALRLPMFDEYGFPANYPICLAGNPPSNAPAPTGLNNGFGAQQNNSHSHSYSAGEAARAVSLEELVHSFPSRHDTIDTILHIRLGHRVPQSVLGVFESDYIFEPRALMLLEQDLDQVSEKVHENNRLRDLHHQYVALDPKVMPNYPGL